MKDTCRSGLAGWMVAGIVLAVFLPAVFNDFVDWDDVTFIVGNPRFNPPTLETVHYYWTHPGGVLYIPCTFTLWAGLAKIGYLKSMDAMGTQLNPYVFHLASVLLHLTATMAVFGILKRLVGAVWPAAAGALLFAVHPLQVEPVAFIVGMTAPLAGALSLVSLWLYLSEPADRRWWSSRYLLATLLVAVATLCKPTAVITPVLAFSLEIAEGRRSVRAALGHVLPWVVLVIPCLIWTRIFQSSPAAVAAMPLWTRPLIAGDTLAFYLWKLVVPHPLAIDYGRTPQFVMQHVWGRFTWMAPALLMGAAWVGRRRWPLIGVGLLLFVAAVLPNSGLTPFTYQEFSTTADRYMYLSMLGAALVFAAAIAEVKSPAIVVVVLLACVVVSESQIRFWRNGETLFRHAIAVNPNSWMSWSNLADIMADRAPAEAIYDCQQALRINPADANSWNTLGSILMSQGDPPGAVEAFARACSLAPDNALYASNYRRATGSSRN